MIKKRYLVTLSAAVISLMLGSLLYNNITQALKGKESTEVEVTNFPLDEQGNFKISFLKTSKVITVVKDLNVSFSGLVYPYPYKYYFTEPIAIDGYTQQYLYLDIKNWTTLTGVYVWVEFITDNIIYESSYEASVSGEATSMIPYEPMAPTIRIRITAESRTYYAGSVLVSISLYLRN